MCNVACVAGGLRPLLTLLKNKRENIYNKIVVSMIGDQSRYTIECAIVMYRKVVNDRSITYNN